MSRKVSSGINKIDNDTLYIGSGADGYKTIIANTSAAEGYKPAIMWNNSDWVKSADGYTFDTIRSGTIGVGDGGTGITSYSSGEMIYASATNTLGKIPAGPDGYVLTSISGVPTWNKLLSSTDGYVSTNRLHIGDGTASDKIIFAENAAANKPYIKYDDASTEWLFSDDGTSVGIFNNLTIASVIEGYKGTLSPAMDGYISGGSLLSGAVDGYYPAYVVSTPGKLRKLVVTSTSIPTGAETVVITLRKNLVDTPITVTLDSSTPAGVVGYIETDMVNTISVSQGDWITIRYVCSASGTVDNIRIVFEIGT